MATDTLVILHGWTQNHHRWQQLITTLRQKGYQVLYPRLPGFDGKPLARAWRLTDYVTWFKQYVKHKQLARYTIVAHSNGGRIALKLAAEHPPELAKLVLINSAGIKSPPRLKTAIFWLIAKLGKGLFVVPGISVMRQFMRRLLYKAAKEQDYLEASPALAATMRHLISLDLTATMKQIKIPTLVVWGGQDKTTPLKEGLTIARQISQTQVTIFPQATHALPYQEPNTLAEVIDDFLDS